MAKAFRDKICLAIASLETEEDVKTKLKLLLDEAETKAEPVEVGISPLLVASDRGNVACLHFLASYDASVAGSPLDASAEQDGGNTPVHHAAMSGCIEAWKIFGEILNKSVKESSTIFTTLGSLTNAHGDTPLQIAVSAGHLEFVQQWHQLASENGTTSTELEIRSILQSKNHAGDTCASLACCHGHSDILGYLLNECRVSISQEEVATCQVAVDRMDQALKTVTDPKAVASFQGRQARVHDCLSKLKAAIVQQAEDAANELLAESEDAKAVNDKLTSKKKKKGKGNRKASTKKSQEIIPESTVSTDQPQQEDPLKVQRLDDGRVAVSVQGPDISTAGQPPSTHLVPPSTAETPSAETMLRQRFRREAPNSDIDAVMDALCLDVSMLLYTPHGMALNLSPSQLDAVEQILQKQIRSVQEARNLQERMHHPVPEGPCSEGNEAEKGNDADG